MGYLGPMLTEERWPILHERFWNIEGVECFLSACTIVLAISGGYLVLYVGRYGAGNGLKVG